jgi:uncharacterized protein (DUF1330 family)
MPDDKIYMLNALWFKPGGGADTYRKYLKAATPLVEKYGGRKATPSFLPDKSIIGEFDADLVFFVEYPSWTAFKQMIADPEYLEKAAPLREAAITKSLLIRCAKV